MTDAGAIGLFGDDDERGEVTELSDQHERGRLELKIRRQGRRANRQYRKELKAADCKAKKKPKLLCVTYWIERLFSRRGDLIPESHSGQLVGEANEDQSDQSMKHIVVTTEYVVVRKPSTQSQCIWQTVLIPLIRGG
jgi:hypothetical protein